MGSLQRRCAPFAGEAGRALRELHLSRVPKIQLGRDVCPRLKCKAFQERTEADASEGRVAGSKMLETPSPSLPRQYTHSSPNICSGEKELAELLDIQQGPSVLSPPLLGAPPGSEWRRRRLKI